ncbi:MAG: hypothetical protein ACOCZ3_03000 [Bacillota bacterium]
MTRIIIMLMMSLWWLFIPCSRIQAEPATVVWIVIEGLGIEDVIEGKTPNLDLFQSTGASGLMNVRLQDRQRAGSIPFFNFNSKISKISLNIDNYNREDRGITSNSDRQPGPVDFPLPTAGGEYGFTETDQSTGSELSPGMEIDPLSLVTDRECLENFILDYWPGYGVLILNLGDLKRLEDYRFKLPTGDYLQARQRIITRFDHLLGLIQEQLDLSVDYLGLTVPSPPATARSWGYRLGWTVLAGPGLEHGWLTSPTTRRQGLIGIQDLGPTLIESAGLPVDSNTTRGLIGSNMFSLKADIDWIDLQDLNDRITGNSRRRPLFIRVFIGIQLLVIMLAIARIFWKLLHGSVIIQRLLEYLLIALLFLPLNYLVISRISLRNIWYYIVMLTGLSIMEIYPFYKRNKALLIKALIAGWGLVLVIIYDLITGYQLMADSLLGYSSIIGARYYGLGNEYMGLMIGGYLIGFMILAELLPANYQSRLLRVFPLLTVLITFFIGTARFGANFGGTITIMVAGTISWFHMSRQKLTKRRLIGMVSLSGLLFVFILYLDYRELMGVQSHIGRALGSLLSGDLESIRGILTRKLMINLRLLRWTIWTRVLLAFIVYLLVIFTRPSGKLEYIFGKYSLMTAGFYGGLGGSVATMLVNDSGVVAAATLLFYPMLILLYLIQDLS